MRQDFDGFFRDYTELYNQALAGRPNYQRIMDCFAECFMSSGPSGVNCGDNGPKFRDMLKQGYAFYRQIGAKRMNVLRCEITDIDPDHHMVKVFYRADYEKDGKPISIDFDVTYLLTSAKGKAKIFAFVAGDEMGAYRRAGLIT